MRFSYLVFTCQKPKKEIYTADFTVTGMANDFPLEGPIVDTWNASAPNLVYITPEITLVLPNTTVVSTLKPTLAATASTTTAPPMTITPPPDPPRQASSAQAVGVRKRPTVDLERLKFRFVFIFWPTIIGLTMAL